MEKPSKEPSTLANFFSAVDKKYRTSDQLIEFVFVDRQQYTILPSVFIQDWNRKYNLHSRSSLKVFERYNTPLLPPCPKRKHPLITLILTPNNFLSGSLLTQCFTKYSQTLILVHFSVYSKKTLLIVFIFTDGFVSLLQ